MSLLKELQRRNVFKVAIAYIVMAWLVLQVADVVLNNITAPGWIFKVLMLFLAIGLPFAVFFAWAFELTPEGLKRESEVDRTQSITPQTGKKLNLVITAVLVLALGYFAYDKFILSSAREAALVESTTQAITERAAAEQAETKPEDTTASDKSIAVLPFADMSPNKDQDFFSDGLSEELLNLLARIPELKVAARTSSFQFKGQTGDIADIGKQLKVAYVLEGSVRTSGKRVRVTAQLIQVKDGFHLWSETYDRDLDDIFAIQDEIASGVVAQLKLHLLGAAPTADKYDPQAYALFLRGRQLSRQYSASSLEQANALYEQALAIDPGYAVAWAELSRNYINQTTNDLLPVDEGLAMARKATGKALAINPDLALGAAQNGFYAMEYDNDLQTAARYFERALKLEPANLDIIRNASQLIQSLGRLDEAIALGEYITARDPVNAFGHVNLGTIYFNAGRLDDALTSFQIALSLSPEYIGVHYFVGTVLLLQNQPEVALTAFTKEGDDEYRIKGSALALYSLGRETEYQAALAELQERWGDRWPADVAAVYAWSGDADSALTSLERGIALGSSLSGVDLDPFLASLHDDPRWRPWLEKAGRSPEQLAAIKFKVTLPN